MPPIRIRDLPLPDASLDRAFFDLWIHDFGACALSAADEVGVFVALAQNAHTLQELADLLRLQNEPLQALCHALVALDALSLQGQSFTLTPFARAFWVKRSPLYRGREFDRHRAWEQHQRIVDALDNGWSPLPDDDTQSFSDGWRNGTISKDSADAFTRVMHSFVLTPAIAAVRSGVFENARHVVDVGGGSGAFAAALVSHHPGMRATIMDLPPVIETSKTILAQVDRGDEVEHVACNFFVDPWPRDADAFLFSSVLHDWPMDDCRSLLERAREALRPGGVVFVHEMLLEPNRQSPASVTLFHLLMQINHRGQQLTFAELTALLEGAGFRDPRQVHAYGYWALARAELG